MGFWRKLGARPAESLDAWLQRAEQRFDEGDYEGALAQVRQVRALVGAAAPGELRGELWVFECDALAALGRAEEALTCVEQALALAPARPELVVERALLLFEACRFDEAGPALEEARRAAPDDAAVLHAQGMLAERRGAEDEAAAHYRAAAQLAPDDYPVPLRVSASEFDEALTRAMERLPEDVRPHLENTTVCVDLVPSLEDLRAQTPPHSPQLLGLFRGVPVGHRSVSNAEDHFPAQIVLYQRNLERIARSREELVEQIEITLLHEVGHLVGLDEEGLAERGLD